MKRLCIAIAMITFASMAFSLELVEVIDADTIVVRDGDQQWEAQVHGIDAPGLDEPFGEYARTLVVMMLSRDMTLRRAEFEPEEVDASSSMMILQHELVRLGLARTNGGTHERWLMAPEWEAREAGLGIWSENP